MSQIKNLTPDEKAQRRANRAKKRLAMLLSEMRKDVSRLREMVKPPAR